MGTAERARVEKLPELPSAQAILFELQVEQHHHDEMYHREIARLPLHQRLNHMALHFAKYAGKVAAKQSVLDAVPIYVDVLVIALSTANVLNAEIWSLLDHDGQTFRDLRAFGLSTADHRDEVHDYDALLRATCGAAGRIAGACEKIDHLEELSFRSEIKAGLAQLAGLALAILATHGLDPSVAVRKRLQDVKSRLFLHGRI